MTTHYGRGLITKKNVRLDSYFSEDSIFDVEKDKSSDISIISDGKYGKNIILKKKKRNFDKVVYESFMMDFWNNLLDLYSKENNLNLNSPISHDIIYDFDKRESILAMDFCPGRPIKKIPYLKSDYLDFNGKNVHKSNVISYYSGVLNKIKDSEYLLHSDYDDRHILFYNNPVKKINSMSVIDVENSKFSESREEVNSESKNLEEILKKHFHNDDDYYFYNKGYESIDSLYSREDIFSKTEKSFNQKFKKNEKPYVVVDPYNSNVYC